LLVGALAAAAIVQFGDKAVAMFDDALKRPDASEQDAVAKLRT
jgi:hypothetical protein